MNRVIETVSSFPTVIFTAVFAFCLAWWLVSLFVSGIDGTGEADVDADADFDADIEGDIDGDIDTGDDLSVKMARALHIGEVPLSMSLTVLSFGAWAMSGLAQLVIDDIADQGKWGTGLRFAAALGILAVGLLSGFGLLRVFAKATKPVFVTTLATSRHGALGATCRIRTTNVTASLGEAEVMTGENKGQIVKVRTDRGDFVRGDVAQLVGYDDDTGAFTIVELDPVLRDSPS